MSKTPIRLTREEALALRPCSTDKVPDFGRKKYFTAKEALAAGVSIPDLLWVAGRLGLKRQCVEFALGEAQSVAYLNPDPRVQAAIDAGQACLANPTPETAYAAADAADAANAAADAADAANAAADAAPETAYAAADAAANAARAAANAAADAAPETAYAAANAAANAANAAANAARAAANAAANAARAAQRERFLAIFG